VGGGLTCGFWGVFEGGLGDLFWGEIVWILTGRGKAHPGAKAQFLCSRREPKAEALGYLEAGEADSQGNDRKKGKGRSKGQYGGLSTPPRRSARLRSRGRLSMEGAEADSQGGMTERKARANTGGLRCAQDDDEKRSTAKIKAIADIKATADTKATANAKATATKAASERL